ncbi:MAG TPA: O-methyltransferase [Puia sp.]|jgi:caffeoyl-CoA O-methyltransferase|nr:O-methyltransferase [Puia sp.]
MDTHIFKEVDNYISSLLIHEDEVLLSVPQTLKDANLPFSTVSPNQGKFLHIMALACNAKNILELGTLGGYSAIWLARALPENGKMITVEIDPARAAVAKKNIARAGLSGKVEIRVGKAMEILHQLKQENAEPFDLIFIDADKEPYAEYFQLSLQLSGPGTFIIADNVIREGEVMNEKIKDGFINGVQRFNNLLAMTPNVTSTIIQTVGIKPHDGISLSIVDRK